MVRLSSLFRSSALLAAAIVAAMPNGLTVEYMPWSLRLWEETPKIENGMIVVPQKPGLGLKFDEGVLKRYGA